MRFNYVLRMRKIMLEAIDLHMLELRVNFFRHLSIPAGNS